MQSSWTYTAQSCFDQCLPERPSKSLRRIAKLSFLKIGSGMGRQLSKCAYYLAVYFFIEAFELQKTVGNLVIDISKEHLCDLTVVGALGKIAIKFRRAGADVEVLGLNAASAGMVNRWALHNKDERASANASLH